MRNHLLGVFCLLPILASAQLDTAAFNAFVNKAAQDFELPAMSIAVAHKGEVIYRNGFGKKSSVQKEASNAETLFAIASLSKAFTTAAMAMLVEEGKVNWDDPVVKHLPWFELHDEYVTNHITIEDILSHRSGLKTFDGDLLWYGTDYTRREVVQRIKERPLTYEFRDKFGYQNIMFITAGEVIAAVSGMSWDEFVKERILKPLEMSRTTTDFDRFSMDRNVAMPHINGKEIFTLSYENSGATAALNSCTRDLIKWSKLWLNDGIVNGDTLLSAKNIDRIWTIHTALPTGSFDEQHGVNFKGYGMGWFLMEYGGKKIAHHGGGLPGYISKIALSPEDDFAVVVLTNDMSSAPTMLMYAALDWLNGKDYSEWVQTFLDFKKSGEERDNKEKQARLAEQIRDPIIYELSDYVGVYQDSMYGPAEVLLVEGELILKLIPSKELFSGILKPWSNHAFQFNHNDPFLTYGVINFKIKQDVIQGFTIDLPNQDFHFDKLYFKAAGNK